MRKFILFTIFCLLVVFNGTSQSSMQRFEEANALYEQGEYQQAESIYLELIDEGYLSDDLHYNLANALFKTKKIAPAILHYEKALKINPSHEDARYNLKLANGKTVDNVEAIPDLFIYRWWRAIYNLFPADNWAKIMITFLLIALAGFCVFRFSRNVSSKKFGFVLLSGGFLLGLICWVLAIQQRSYAESSTHAIIMQATVNIISAPSEGSSQLFVLHEGTKVKIKDKTGDWLKVALPNGNEGWLQKDKLAAI